MYRMYFIFECRKNAGNITYHFTDVALQKITKMSTTLSYDRRAIDEDQAADFLAVLKAMLEDPSFLVAGKLRALRYAQNL